MLWLLWWFPYKKGHFYAKSTKNNSQVCGMEIIHEKYHFVAIVSIKATTDAFVLTHQNNENK